jgi:hypothetical protein
MRLSGVPDARMDHSIARRHDEQIRRCADMSDSKNTPCGKSTRTTSDHATHAGGDAPTFANTFEHAAAAALPEAIVTIDSSISDTSRSHEAHVPNETR